MPDEHEDIASAWRDLGEKIEKLRAETDELKKERRTLIITLIERKKNTLAKENAYKEERVGKQTVFAAYKMPEPWDNYYYADGFFYTRALAGTIGASDMPLLRQIGEGETDVLTGGSNLIDSLLALQE